MIILQALAEDFSSLLGMPFLKQNDIFLFELGQRTSMVLEMQAEDHLFVSLCYKSDVESLRRDLLINLLKLLHPLKNPHFFCKTLLLEAYVVISVNESIQQLSAKRLYRFKNYALKALVKAGVKEI